MFPQHNIQTTQAAEIEHQQDQYVYGMHCVTIVWN
jgi:hypothetical protein